MSSRLYVTTVSFRDSIPLRLPFFRNPIIWGSAVLLGAFLMFVCLLEAHLLLQAHEKIDALQEREALQAQVMYLETMSHEQDMHDCREEVVAYRGVLKKFISRLGLDRVDDPKGEPNPFALYLANLDSR